jgi:hypothetical protein
MHVLPKCPVEDFRKEALLDLTVYVGSNPDFHGQIISIESGIWFGFWNLRYSDFEV